MIILDKLWVNSWVKITVEFSFLYVTGIHKWVWNYIKRIQMGENTERWEIWNSLQPLCWVSMWHVGSKSMWGDMSNHCDTKYQWRYLQTFHIFSSVIRGHLWVIMSSKSDFFYSLSRGPQMLSIWTRGILSCATKNGILVPISTKLIGSISKLIRGRGHYLSNLISDNLLTPRYFQVLLWHP